MHRDKTQRTPFQLARGLRRLQIATTGFTLGRGINTVEIYRNTNGYHQPFQRDFPSNQLEKESRTIKQLSDLWHHQLGVFTTSPDF